AVVDDEGPVLGGDRRGRGRIGPVQATPGVVHDAHDLAYQVGMDRRQAQRPIDLVALPGAVVLGRLVVMMRADTICAPGAMPPGQRPNGMPAAICATAVPWPTTSSTRRSLLAGST